MDSNCSHVVVQFGSCYDQKPDTGQGKAIIPNWSEDSGNQTNIKLSLLDYTLRHGEVLSHFQININTS